MDGLGHLPMVESPGQVAADYLRFRSQLDSAPTDGSRAGTR
jgi:hypothetical protein